MLTRIFHSTAREGDPRLNEMRRKRGRGRRPELNGLLIHRLMQTKLLATIYTPR